MMSTQEDTSRTAEALTRHQKLAARRRCVDGKMIAVDAPTHGESSIYKNWGCRCTPCTLANTAAEKDLRRRRWDRTMRNGGIAPGARAHGRPCTYWNWGCQCAPCLNAAAHARSGQRALSSLPEMT